MQENLKEPIGLQVNGAFSVRGLEIFNQYKEVQNYDDVEEYVEEILQKCDAEICILNKCL